MNKYVLVDINNTLLDSENRKAADIYFLGLIHKDKPRYGIIRLLKLYWKNGYKLIFFNYCNAKFEAVIQQAMEKCGFDPNSYTLFMDVANEKINDAYSLKRYVCENILRIANEDVLCAIDNDKKSIDFYKANDIVVLEVK